MTQKFMPHILALSALTTLGNAIIVMSNLNVINLFISLVLSLAMILFVSFLFNLLKDLVVWATLHHKK